MRRFSRRASARTPQRDEAEQVQCPFQSANVLVSSRSKLVCVTDEESLAAEKFRFLGVRLRHLQQKRPLKRLLITSSMPEEGKSTVAANLACALATRQQQKMLLLEGDLRRPTLAQQFGLGKLPGLSELLEGEPSPTMNIYRLESLGFWILPAGSPPATLWTLCSQRRLPMLMDQLSSWFDWIVIDSPPVLPLADTSVWMRLADAILLVTRPGRTAKRQLQRSLEMVEQPKLLGAVVNGSTRRRFKRLLPLLWRPAILRHRLPKQPLNSRLQSGHSGNCWLHPFRQQQLSTDRSE